MSFGSQRVLRSHKDEQDDESKNLVHEIKFDWGLNPHRDRIADVFPTLALPKTHAPQGPSSEGNYITVDEEHWPIELLRAIKELSSKSQGNYAMVTEEMRSRIARRRRPRNYYEAVDRVSPISSSESLLRDVKMITPLVHARVRKPRLIPILKSSGNNWIRILHELETERRDPNTFVTQHDNRKHTTSLDAGAESLREAWRTCAGIVCRFPSSGWTVYEHIVVDRSIQTDSFHNILAREQPSYEGKDPFEESEKFESASRALYKLCNVKRDPNVVKFHWDECIFPWVTQPLRQETGHGRNKSIAAASETTEEESSQDDLLAGPSTRNGAATILETIEEAASEQEETGHTNQDNTEEGPHGQTVWQIRPWYPLRSGSAIVARSSWSQGPPQNRHNPFTALGNNRAIRGAATELPRRAASENDDHVGPTLEEEDRVETATQQSSSVDDLADNMSNASLGARKRRQSFDELSDDGLERRFRISRAKMNYARWVLKTEETFDELRRRGLRE